MSSVNGLQSFGGTASYCASKAAVDMLTRCASVDLAPFGIRVNSVIQIQIPFLNSNSNFENNNILI